MEQEQKLKYSGFLLQSRKKIKTLLTFKCPSTSLPSISENLGSDSKGVTIARLIKVIF